MWAAEPTLAHVPEAPKLALKTASAVNVKASDFVLLDQDNRRFDTAKLRGKVVVLNFIFTTCTDVCPIFTANLATLQRKLNDRYGDGLFFLSVTTDPEIDSAKVLKAYAGRYGADLKNWAFLTGPETDLKPVWNAYGVRVIRKARGLVQHTSLTTVIDVRGIRRFNFLGEKWPLRDLERDVLALLEK
ncbi:MAG TPA: SCO family protein [Candidatus Binatia bacterium]|nr:SCO family protein [Candidatus Binatia bacterium]